MWYTQTVDVYIFIKWIVWYVHVYLSKASFKRTVCKSLIFIVRKLVLLVKVGYPFPY